MTAGDVEVRREATPLREFSALREYYRALAVVGVLGVAGFSWIHRAAAPDAVDPIWQRVLMAGVCLALFVGTWRLTPRSLTRLAQVVYYALTIWVLQLVIINQFAQDYALAYIVVTAGIAGTYRDRRQLLYYLATALAGVAVAAGVVEEPEVSVLVYAAYSLVMAVLVYVGVTARLELDMRRAHSEERYAVAAEQLVHEATHDSLTGLPNRALLLDRLERLLASARRRTDARFAVLMIDLDRFKRVNDSLGHATGDLLLEQVAERLAGVLRVEDTLARVGGDEFVVVVPTLREDEDVLRVAERLSASLAPPVSVGGQAIHVEASIGITVGPHGYTAPGEMLRDADLAMHRSKQARLGRPQLFDDAMHLHAVRQLRLEAELRRALSQSELELHYQPIIALDSGRIHGFEALVRWRHPESGLLLPGEFLPIAEETGLIVEIGRWALGEACRTQRKWSAGATPGPWTAGDVAIPIHVNLSAAHFAAGTVVQDVMRALEECGGGACIGIEITEGVLLGDPAAAADVLTELKRLGVAVAIDDFGTGYSSLRYLHSLPADVLKIDRSFVARAGESGGLALIRSIVLLAERLGLQTVAEGIETQEQARLMETVGATHGQGFFYSAARPESDTAAALAGRPAS